jgi:hypothetical protein
MLFWATISTELSVTLGMSRKMLGSWRQMLFAVCGLPTVEEEYSKLLICRDTIETPIYITVKSSGATSVAAEVKREGVGLLRR